MRMKGQVYAACIRSCLVYECETWAMRAELESKMACIRSCLLYECETWAMPAELESKTEMMEMWTIRLMCGDS